MKSKNALEESNKKLQEARDIAEKATYAKSYFLANMSHELRTPLNGMIGMLDMLKNTIQSPVQKEQFEVIYHSGEFLLSLITDILEFSKIESGKLEIAKRSFDLPFRTLFPFSVIFKTP